MLRLDNRERDLIPLLPTATVQQLPVGDIWIGEGPGSLVIERKAVADLESSLLDGRYREQRTRLLAHCAAEQKRPLQIIEGDLDRLQARKPERELTMILNRLMLRQGVPVWRTDNLQGTAKYCTLLAEQQTKDPTVFQAETVSQTDVQHITKKANREDPTNFAAAVLQQCPGVSAKVAQAILAAYPALPQILALEPKTLADIKAGDRRIGPKVAERLLGLLKGTAST